MEYTEKLIEMLRNKITSRIDMLENEIVSLKMRQREDEVIYGFGGFYMRKEHAISIRKDEIKKLKEFQKQLHHPIMTKEAVYSTIYCKNCHNEMLTKGPVTGEWHECLVCRKMVFGSSGKKLIIYTSEEYLNK